MYLRYRKWIIDRINYIIRESVIVFWNDQNFATLHCLFWQFFKKNQTCLTDLCLTPHSTRLPFQFFSYSKATLEFLGTNLSKKDSDWDLYSYYSMWATLMKLVFSPAGVAQWIEPRLQTIGLPVWFPIRSPVGSMWQATTQIFPSPFLNETVKWFSYTRLFWSYKATPVVHF